MYVGKAKNLKKRVASYFNRVHEYPKVNVLVKNIHHLKYIVVDTEADALLLESNLIKQYRPRYNAMLKDDKSYPSICITREDFPRVFKIRNTANFSKQQLFGPYSTEKSVILLLSLIYEMYPLRTCKLPLTEENIKKGKFKVCLKYHIHKCSGVCEGKESMESYLLKRASDAFLVLSSLVL